MTATLWHRFASRDLQAVLRSLDDLNKNEDDFVSDDEKKQISLLKSTVSEGFAAKQDGPLDLGLLILCLEFSIVACHSERADQLRQILQRVRKYQTKHQPAAMSASTKSYAGG